MARGVIVTLRPSVRCEYETRSQLRGLTEAFSGAPPRLIETDPDRITLAWLRERCRRCGACAAMLVMFAALTPDPRPEDLTSPGDGLAEGCPSATQQLLAN